MTTLNPAKLELDDRREIWRLLKRLDQWQRVEFLKWCCRQVSGPFGHEVRVTSSTGTAQEVYWDIMMLCFGNRLEGDGLLLGKIAERLVQVVRKL